MVLITHKFACIIYKNKINTTNLLIKKKIKKNWKSRFMLELKIKKTQKINP